MRKITLLIAFLLSCISYSQVTIGNGTNEAQGVPFEPYFGYSYGQSVYLASEINANGNITGLQWYFSGTTLLPNSQGLTIYLGHSTRTAFASTSDWEPIANLTQVYTGGISVSGTGWVTITFDTPFAYNGTDNLIIAVDENMASYDASTDDFYNSAVTGNRSICYRSDSTNPDPFGTLPTATGTYAYVPNIVLQGISPACVTPSNLVANNVMPSSVDLSWTDPSGSQNDYEYVIQASGTGIPTGSGTPNSGTSVTDNTVIPNTLYEVYVRANCGAVNGYSTWAGPITFRTPCNTFTAPWIYDVETAAATTNSSIYDCWSSSPTGSTSVFRWDVTATGTTPTASTGASIANSGSKYFYSESSSGSTGAIAELLTPAIDVSGLSDPTLQFYYHMFGATMGELHVDIYDGAVWNSDVLVITGQQQTAQADQWTLGIVSLNSLTISGDVRARFRGVRGTGITGDICLDDISFDEAPACFDPINLAVSNITSSSVDFQFDDASGGNQFDFWYVVQPAGTGTGGTLVENYYDYSSGVPFTATCTDVDNDCANTGLQPNTAYEIYVRADCSSNWVGPINFRTLCNAFDTFPFVETFNTDSTSEACWSVINSNGDADQWNMNGTTIPRSGQAAQLYTDFNSSNNDYLVSPQLDLGTTAKRLKFWVRHYSNSEPDNLNVRISTTGNDIPSFASNLLLSLSTTQITTTYTEYIVDLSAYSGLVYIAFAREDAPADGWYISIDDVTVEDIPATAPSCASNVVGTPDASCGNFANVITWDATSGADGYYLTIGTTSTGTDILNNQDLGNVLTYSFTGTLNTTYFYTLVPYNSNGPATGCTEMSFTTSANGCYCVSNPTSVDADGITNVQVVATDFPNSVNSAPVYNDHTATVVDMSQGINNNVQITLSVASYTYNTVIWVDFNDDYNFDASEQVYSGSSSTGVLNASFVMPATAPLGQHRMRVISAWNVTPTECYSGSYAETADFTVNIVTASCTPATVASSTVVEDCANSQFSVDVDVTALGDGTPSITDGTTSWPVSATGVIAVGPFNYGTPVTLTLLHGSDNVCNVTIGTFNYAVCPPANDDCANAEVLTLGAVFTDNPVVGTNVGATASTGAPAPGCASYSGGDVWYSAVVPASGSLTFEMNSQSGGITDGGGAVYSGSCGALTLLDCDDYSSSDPNDMPLIEVTGRTPGEVLYFRVWEYGNISFGEFLVSAYDASLSTNVFENNNFRAYPNPVKDILTLEYSSDITSVTVFNLLGQQVISRSLNATSANIDMSQLNAGAYLVSVKMGDVEKTIKVVKQ